MGRFRGCCLGGTILMLLFAAAAQSSSAAEDSPIIVSHAVADLAASSATIEAAIVPGSAEASYEVTLVSTPCESIRPPGRNSLGECEGQRRREVVANGSLAPGTEAQTVAVPVSLEEAQEYTYEIAVKSTAGSVSAVESFTTPDAAGTGKPDFMSFTETDLAPKTIKLEATFDLEGPTGEYALGECGCFEKKAHRRLLDRAALTESGLQTLSFELKDLKEGHEYVFWFNLANESGAKHRGLVVFAPSKQRKEKQWISVSGGHTDFPALTLTPASTQEPCRAAFSANIGPPGESQKVQDVESAASGEPECPAGESIAGALKRAEAKIGGAFALDTKGLAIGLGTCVYEVPKSLKATIPVPGPFAAEIPISAKLDNKKSTGTCAATEEIGVGLTVFETAELLSEHVVQIHVQ